MGWSWLFPRGHTCWVGPLLCTHWFSQTYTGDQSLCIPSNLFLQSVHCQWQSLPRLCDSLLWSVLICLFVNKVYYFLNCSAWVLQGYWQTMTVDKNDKINNIETKSVGDPGGWGSLFPDWYQGFDSDTLLSQVPGQVNERTLGTVACARGSHSRAMAGGWAQGSRHAWGADKSIIHFKK